MPFLSTSARYVGRFSEIPKRVAVADRRRRPTGFSKARRALSRRPMATNSHPISLFALMQASCLGFLRLARRPRGSCPRDRRVRAFAFPPRSGPDGAQIRRNLVDPMLPRPGAMPVSSPQGLLCLAIPFHRLVIVRSTMEADDASVFRQSGLQEKVRRGFSPAIVFEGRNPVGRNVGERAVPLRDG